MPNAIALHSSETTLVIMKKNSVSKTAAGTTIAAIIRIVVTSTATIDAAK
jgi:hypothetical protein